MRTVPRLLNSQLNIRLVGLRYCGRLWNPVLLVLVVACCGCGRAPSIGGPQSSNAAANSDGQDSHEWMKKLLEQYRVLTITQDPFLGERELQTARGELARLRGRDDPVAEAEIRQRIADHELRLGRVRESLQHHERIRELMSRPGQNVPASVRADATLNHAVAYLRLGETENCVNCRDGAACLLPIRDAGIHQLPEGSEKAITLLNELLKLNSENLTARWLLNIAHMTLGQYPDHVPAEFRISPEKFRGSEPFPAFPNIANSRGLDTLSLSGGVVADDLDNNGSIDLLVSDWSTSGQLRLFLNDGRGTFREDTVNANLTGLFGGLNMVHADYDNDGDIDVYVLRGAWKGKAGRQANSLLKNDGAGKFTDVTRDAGLALEHFPTQTASWDDYDLDGDPDLAVGNEEFPCQLFNNDGKGHFTDVAEAAGIDNQRFAKAVIWGDFDSDRYPDLYVSNYDSENRLYHNQRDGTFRDVAADYRVQLPLKSFPAWFWDFNNDGALDLFVASYPMDMEQMVAGYFDRPTTTELNHLYRARSEGGFEEVAQELGLHKATSVMGCNFGDLDNDGFLDFYLGTGAPPYHFLTPNLMYWNRNGTRFADVTFNGGFGHLQKGHAVAFADFDSDGDQDVFQDMGGAYPGDAFPNALFENPGNDNHWITIQLEGRESIRCAIGARICVTSGAAGQHSRIFRWVNSGGSFGCNPLRQHIGIGSAETVDSIEVFWPRTGKTQTVMNVAGNQSVRIVEGVAGYSPFSTHQPTRASVRFPGNIGETGR